MIKPLSGSDELQPLTLTWHRYIDYALPRRLRQLSAIMLLVFGFMAVTSPLIGLPGLAITFGGAAALSLTGLLPLRTRVTISSSELIIRRQPLLTNSWLWLTVVLAVVGCGFVVQLLIEQSWDVRVLLLCIAAFGLSACVAVRAYKLRGPMAVDSENLSFATGWQIPLLGSRVEVIAPSAQAAPVVRVIPPKTAGLALTAYRIDPRAYGLDPNTLASTIAQLAMWAEAGSGTTPAQIEGMLRTRPPSGVAVGDSIQLSLAVAQKESSG